MNICGGTCGHIRLQAGTHYRLSRSRMSRSTTSRFPEDPVTGSAHCTLVPYWSKRLGKARLTARQLSHRGGDLFCEDQGQRVQIAGRAVLYLQGQILI
jgi:predicted PhzF superfamily epimerase YddE/YHI9